MGLNLNPAGSFDKITCRPIISKRKNRVCVDYTIACINSKYDRGILITVTQLGEVLNWCRDNTFMSRKIAEADDNFPDVKFVIIKGEIRTSQKDLKKTCSYLECWLPSWVGSRILCDRGRWDSVMLDLRKRGISNESIRSSKEDARNMGRI